MADSARSTDGMTLPVIPPASADCVAGFLASAISKDHDTFSLSVGLRAFANYAEHLLADPQCAFARELVITLERQELGQVQSDHLIDVASRVLHILKEKPDSSTSIDDVVTGLFAFYGTDMHLAAKNRRAAQRFVFLAIGIASTLYKPDVSTPTALFQVCKPNQEGRTSMTADVNTARRPIPALLRQLGALSFNRPPSQEHIQAVRGEDSNDEALPTADLSFSALRHVGKISIEWVDSLDAHLNFRLEQQKLFLFRFPSLCAAAYLSGDESILASIVARNTIGESSKQSGYTSSIEDGSMKSLVREVLQSYRLVFGQDKRSRTMYWNTIRPSLRKDKCHDPFLDDLCRLGGASFESRWPDLGELLNMREMAFHPSDFAVYGERLGKIQRYIGQRQPRRLLEMWRDRRNPEKFFTFWAVIIFGGVTVILSLVQIALTAGQLVLSYKQLHQSNGRL